MQEKTFDYIEEAHVTVSDKYYGELVSLSHFLSVASGVIQSAKRLDQIKKTVFYGRNCGISNPQNGVTTLSQYSVFISDSCAPEDTKNAINLFHGIIGKVTEAAELLEALVKVTEGLPLDFANIREEIGDGLWYDAIILRAIDSNFGEAQHVNIAKLRKRFPNAFTEYEANNRDLFAEREVLENKTVEHPTHDPNGAEIIYCDTIDKATGQRFPYGKSPKLEVLESDHVATNDKLAIHPVCPGEIEAHAINKAAARGLVIQICGPTACGKTISANMIRSLIPNAKVIEKD